jgi:hypothetical protein
MILALKQERISMSLNQLTPETIIGRSEALLSSNLGEDVVMMDIEQGSYYGLEAVAARIWALTEQPVSVGALCEQLVAEYQVAPEQCRQEVITFLGELLERQIVQVVA